MKLGFSTNTHYERIYNDNYKYSLPENVLESFLSGIAFDYKKKYEPKELEMIKDDIERQYLKVVSGGIGQNVKPLDEHKIAYITAGGPGAGKTLLLRQIVQNLFENGNYTPYVCPDDVCLVDLTGFKEDLAKGAELLREIEDQQEKEDKEKEIRNNAYTKWRPASNAANHFILANLILNNSSFCFGTTSSSPMTRFFFDFLKKRGYEIHLIHVTASSEVCFKSIEERDKKLVQTTLEDIVNKGKDFPQRINDVYLKFADQIDFYYRPEFNKDAVKAARWVRNEKGSEKLGTIHIEKPEEYELIKDIHRTILESVNKEELIWEDSIESVSYKTIDS